MTEALAWRWFDETLDEGYRLGLEIDRVIIESESSTQAIGLYETVKFGRVLTLDGVIQTCERDEFIYHEMMAHMPLFAHSGAGAEALRVCVIGGGDGGMLREILKHRHATATLVEIDGGVIEFCKTHLPNLSAGAFDDPRANIIVADGAAVMASDGPVFDVIIVDSTDPIGPGAILFSEQFYADCKSRLAPGGILVTQNGVPMIQGDDLRRSVGYFAKYFADASCYLAPIPTYFGGFMAFGWASDDDQCRQVTEDVIAKRVAAAQISTRYYNAEIHRAAFALPQYIRTLFDGT